MRNAGASVANVQSYTYNLPSYITSYLTDGGLKYDLTTQSHKIVTNGAPIMKDAFANLHYSAVQHFPLHL